MMIDRRCMQTRKVRSCGVCCRFRECHEGQPLEIVNDKGALKLGMAVVLNVVEEYRNAYRKGQLNTMNRYAKWLRGQQANILTAETFDGQALLDHLEIKCQKEYGDFQVIYNKVQQRLDKQIEELKMDLKMSKSNEERKELKAKIRKLQGDKNL